MHQCLCCQIRIRLGLQQETLELLGTMAIWLRRPIVDPEWRYDTVH